MHFPLFLAKVLKNPVDDAQELHMIICRKACPAFFTGFQYGGQHFFDGGFTGSRDDDLMTPAIFFEAAPLHQLFLVVQVDDARARGRVFVAAACKFCLGHAVAFVQE